MQFVKEFVPDVLSSNFPQPYLITPKAGSRALTYASEDYHVPQEGRSMDLLKNLNQLSEQ